MYRCYQKPLYRGCLSFHSHKIYESDCFPTKRKEKKTKQNIVAAKCSRLRWSSQTSQLLAGVAILECTVRSSIGNIFLCPVCNDKFLMYLVRRG